MKKFDVICVATAGANGYADADDIIAVDAVRNSVDGVATATRTVTGSTTVRYVALTVNGAAKEYAISETCLSGFSVTLSNRYQFALDAKGKLFYNMGFTTTAPVVLVKSAYSTTSADGTVYHIVTDNLDNEVDYVCSADRSGWVDHVMTLTIDMATGKVTKGPDVCPTSTIYTVVAPSASSVTLKDTSNNYTFYDKAAAYSLTDDGYVFIGLGGLAVDDEVTVGGTGAVIVRDDTSN